MSSFWKLIEPYTNYLHNQVQMLNSSKIFAGLIVVTLNIASKFVTIKLSKSMEGYLKYTFSRDILVFSIVWMGSREIYVALLLTLLFILFMDFLFNEESSLCILPNSFTSYHTTLLDEGGGGVPQPDEIIRAQNLLDRVKKNNTENPPLYSSSDSPNDIIPRVDDSIISMIKW
jgi:hypothetical protein